MNKEQLIGRMLSSPDPDVNLIGRLISEGVIEIDLNDIVRRRTLGEGDHEKQ